jgi:hypothetical protein
MCYELHIFYLHGARKGGGRRVVKGREGTRSTRPSRCNARASRARCPRRGRKALVNPIVLVSIVAFKLLGINHSADPSTGKYAQQKSNSFTASRQSTWQLDFPPSDSPSTYRRILIVSFSLSGSQLPGD